MIILAVFVAAAVLPAAVLMRYIYKMDTIEKEPPELLRKLVIFGALIGIPAGFLNTLGSDLLSRFFSPDSLAYKILLPFLIVGIVEEGLKFLVLKRCTWNDPAFNYRFDGVVYAAFVSLGFAALENVMYVFNYGLGIAINRAITAVPAHLGFSVIMGSYYGRAKACTFQGRASFVEVDICSR